MQKLCRAGNLQEAYLILHRLEQAGIAARVLNEHAQSGLGQLPFTHTYPEVWVLESDDAPRARTIVDEYERQAAPVPPRRCRSCAEENPGNFELCWRCGAGL
jgi:putative signal transducing protein